MASFSKPILGRIKAKDNNERLATLLRGSTLEFYVVGNLTDIPLLGALKEFLLQDSGLCFSPNTKASREISKTCVNDVEISTQNCRKKLELLGLPYELRREIFKEFYEIKQTVHLTHGPMTRKPGKGTPSTYRVTNDGMRLMLACRQINKEVCHFNYGSNRFVLTPGEINCNAMGLYPHSLSKLWLHGLRPSTMECVKNLDVHLRLPRVQDIGYLAQGLAMFPHVKVTVQSLKGASGMTWLFQRQTMKLMCEAIAAARSARSTTWDDEGDLETAYLFVDALPTGFKTAGKTAIAGLDGEEAWL